MGAKLHWMKNNANGYLADLELNKLSWAQRGVQQVLFNLAQTQMDEPGYLIKNGVILQSEDIARTVRDTCVTRASDARRTSEHIQRILASGLWRTDARGAYYSPFIVQEYAQSRLAEKGGNVTAKRHAQRDAQRPAKRDAALEPEQNKNQNARAARGGLSFVPDSDRPAPQPPAKTKEPTSVADCYKSPEQLKKEFDEDEARRNKKRSKE